ncbi:Biopolymer transport protein ExbB [Poriferisphaera corsica]|uniref:Biopolymer transport protein ExbB n=2 Tax=Poriferisphaera corsica TaxID=2528020 RepID=A0A517YUC7_9BACT|nr:Biopolymer transport protein ExbB [Poriferisphaera corsica]
MQRGGIMMWPLLALSLTSMTLAFERLWFFVSQNHPGQKSKIDRVGRLLRDGDIEKARLLVEVDRTVYGRAVSRLVNEKNINDAGMIDAVESQRHRLERYMPTLSTIISAAPMIGILGTVIGIISAFQVLSESAGTAETSELSKGIAEALITTAAGLIVMLVTLFPYNAFKAQIERTLSRLESLTASALTPQDEPVAETESE